MVCVCMCMHLCACMHVCMCVVQTKDGLQAGQIKTYQQIKTHYHLHEFLCHSSKKKKKQTHKHSPRVEKRCRVWHQDRCVRLGVVSNGANVHVAGAQRFIGILQRHDRVVPHWVVVVDVQHIYDHLSLRDHICRGDRTKCC